MKGKRLLTHSIDLSSDSDTHSDLADSLPDSLDDQESNLEMLKTPTEGLPILGFFANKLDLEENMAPVMEANFL